MKQKLRHIRAKDRSGAILSKGGATISAVVDENDKVVKFAIAWCHSRDNFSRHVGRVKSTGMMNSENAVTGGGDWNTVVDNVTREVRILQRDFIATELEKLDNKRAVLDRRITALSSSYQDV